MRPATILSLDIADDPAGWARAGFTVADDTVHLGGLLLHLIGPGERSGVVAWSLAGPAGAVGGDRPAGGTLDGLALAAPPRLDPGLLPPSATRHANGATALDHVVITTPDPDATTAAFAAVGWQPRRTIAAPRGPEDRTMTFFVVPAGEGKTVLEVLHDPGQGVSGSAFWGLAVTVVDLDVARRRIGGDALGEPTPAIQPGRRIATVRGERIGISVPLALLTPRVASGAPPGASNGSMGGHG